MADDLYDDDDLENDDDLADDEVILLDDERDEGNDDDTLVLVEEDSIADEEFSEPPGLSGPNTDSGSSDEETEYGRMLEAGAGASPEKDIEGFHVVDLADNQLDDEEDTAAALDDMNEDI